MLWLWMIRFLLLAVMVAIGCAAYLIWYIGIASYAGWVTLIGECILFLLVGCVATAAWFPRQVNRRGNEHTRD